MTRGRGNARGVLMGTLGLAWITVAVLWPQWRDDLRAQGYYGAPLDHYKCYTVGPQTKFDRREVFLEDQFAATDVTVLGPALLCNPVSKDRGDVSNPVDHLVCYRIVETPRRPEHIEVDVDNQFGDDQGLRVLNPHLLCVPSIKTRR